MKTKSIFSRILFIIIMIVFTISLFSIKVYGQDTTNTTLGITVPSGFNWWYVFLFAFGMIVHFIVKIVHTVGWTNLFKGIVDNIIGWFFVQKRYTLLAGSATAVMALASTYNLGIQFAILNPLGIVVALAAGYIGDSAFNSGEIK